MTKLSETQRLILSAAAGRADHSLLPLPETLRGGAAAKVEAALLAKGLAKEVAAAESQPVWSEVTGAALVATEAGLAAAGGNSAPVEGEEPQEASDAPTAPAPRACTKQAQLIEMLRAAEGATIVEIMAATGWQSHTVRGAIAGALKKKRSLDVTSEKVEGFGRVYRTVTVHDACATRGLEFDGGTVPAAHAHAALRAAFEFPYGEVVPPTTSSSDEPARGEIPCPRADQCSRCPPPPSSEAVTLPSAVIPVAADVRPERPDPSDRPRRRTSRVDGRNVVRDTPECSAVRFQSPAGRGRTSLSRGAG